MKKVNSKGVAHESRIDLPGHLPGTLPREPRSWRRSARHPAKGPLQESALLSAEERSSNLYVMSFYLLPA